MWSKIKILNCCSASISDPVDSQFHGMVKIKRLYDCSLQVFSIFCRTNQRSKIKTLTCYEAFNNKRIDLKLHRMILDASPKLRSK